MRTILTTVLLAGAIGGLAPCADGDFQWQGQLAAGQLLYVRGVNGAIHAVGTSGRTATITAHKSGTQSDPSEVEIRVTPYVGGVVVCAMYPDEGQEHPNTCVPAGTDNYLSANNNDVQVEFTISVPPGVRLSAHTVNGAVEATMLTGDVDAASLKGGITISTTGGAQATSLHGSIAATLGSVTWRGTRVFSAGDGDVSVQIPSDANVTVGASAFRGSVTTDFALDLKTSPWGNSTMASGVLGSDGRRLQLSTFNGNISLTQGPPSGN